MTSQPWETSNFAVIQMLERKGKDKRFIKNWRVISLLITDITFSNFF